MVYMDNNGTEVVSFYQTQTVTYFYDETKKEWLASYEVAQADWDVEKGDWGKPLRARLSISTETFTDAMKLVLEHYMAYMEGIGWNLLNDSPDSPYLIKEE